MMNFEQFVESLRNFPSGRVFLEELLRFFEKDLEHDVFVKIDTECSEYLRGYKKGYGKILTDIEEMLKSSSQKERIYD